MNDAEAKSATSPYSVTLKPLYSAPAERMPADISLPDGWQLSWHQVETLQAIRDPNIEVIFNTAMTGDGKSLAAYLETLSTQNCYAIANYPTNELARDQQVQIQDYIAQFQPQPKPRVVQLSSEELELYAEREDIAKSAAIATRGAQSDILVTNPDILHYLHRGAYLTPKDSPDKLWNRIDKDFDLFIFDEFHIFQPPQISSVINTLLLIRNTNRHKKFLFLSATPNSELISRLERVGFQVKTIDPMAQKKYQFPTNLSECQQLERHGWRRVSREISLNFVPLDLSAGSGETWLQNNGDRILKHFQENPGSKGAIILNSIAAVKRLVPWFRQLFQPHGLQVGENTGLSGKTEKMRSLAADLVLGTSTIDVGVDFKINFLIFESADAGNFIQRLGRLGRHNGWNYNGQWVDFHKFTAYALIPQFFVERLFHGDQPPLESGKQYDRVFFHNCIHQNYRKINDFRGYYRKWGPVQSVMLCYQLKHKTVRSQYESSQKSLRDDCENVFETRLGKVAGRIKQWQEEWQQYSGKSGNPIAEDAASFRGSSPLQCGLYDTSEPYAADRFKTYDLPGVLSNLEIEPMSESAFIQLLRDTERQMQVPIAKGRFRRCFAFMKLHRYRQERLRWQFIYAGDLREVSDRAQVQVLTGLQVWQPENAAWIGEANKQLKRQALVSYVLRMPVAEVRSRLRLPMHFQIYPISHQDEVHTSAPYTIAIGQSALLLDTLRDWLRDLGEIWIV
jgi:CRISPR-associated endonuclease/helicase Cas3